MVGSIDSFLNNLVFKYREKKQTNHTHTHSKPGTWIQRFYIVWTCKSNLSRFACLLRCESQFFPKMFVGGVGVNMSLNTMSRLDFTTFRAGSRDTGCFCELHILQFSVPRLSWTTKGQTGWVCLKVRGIKGTYLQTAWKQLLIENNCESLQAFCQVTTTVNFSLLSSFPFERSISGHGQNL